MSDSAEPATSFGDAPAEPRSDPGGLELWRAGGPRIPCRGLTDLLLREGPPSASEPAAAWTAFRERFAARHAEIAAAYESASRRSARRRHPLDGAAIDAREGHGRGREPSYAIDEVWPFLHATRQLPRLRVVDRDGPHAELPPRDVIWLARLISGGDSMSSRIAPAVVQAAAGWREGVTVAWIQGRSIFVIGETASIFQAALSPHHAVLLPPILSSLADELRDLNPWRAAGPRDKQVIESPRWLSLRSRVLEEVGLDLADALPQWQRRAQPAEPAREARSTWRLLAGSDEEEARRALAAIVTRDLAGDIADATLPLRLRRALEAPLVALPQTERDEAHVLADLGAGHLLTIRIRRFREDPLPMEVSREGEAIVLDGADVRVWLRRGYDELLEGRR